MDGIIKHDHEDMRWDERQHDDWESMSADEAMKGWEREVIVNELVEWSPQD